MCDVQNVVNSVGMSGWTWVIHTVYRTRVLILVHVKRRTGDTNVLLIICPDKCLCCSVFPRRIVWQELLRQIGFGCSERMPPYLQHPSCMLSIYSDNNVSTDATCLNHVFFMRCYDNCVFPLPRLRPLPPPAALGTLEFELRYEQSNSELHCTVIRAKVRCTKVTVQWHKLLPLVTPPILQLHSTPLYPYQTIHNLPPSLPLKLEEAQRVLCPSGPFHVTVSGEAQTETE